MSQATKPESALESTGGVSQPEDLAIGETVPEESTPKDASGGDESAADPFADPTEPIAYEGPNDEDDGEEEEQEDGEGKDDDDEEDELEEALFWHEQILGELQRVCRDGDPTRGAYRILAELGADRMGNTTYTARAARTGEVVAVKVTPLIAPIPRVAGQRLIAELFLVRDMRAHPNVLSFLDLYLVQETEVWMVTEHVDGGEPLEALIERNHGAFTEERIARVCLEVCKGLAHLHEQLILHRDIRSASILVSPTGRVKITAFTFAAQLPSPAAKRRTMVSTLALPTTHPHYTPDKTHWTPPEVIRRQPYGPEVDVWALGITVIEMLDGAPPHAGAEPLRVLFLILVGDDGKEGQGPRPRRPVSEALEGWMGGCLEVDVEKRKTVEELLKDPWLETACEIKELGALFVDADADEEEGAGAGETTASEMPSAEATDASSSTAPSSNPTEVESSEDPAPALVMGSTAPRPSRAHAAAPSRPDAEPATADTVVATAAAPPPSLPALDSGTPAVESPALALAPLPPDSPAPSESEAPAPAPAP